MNMPGSESGQTRTSVATTEFATSKDGTRIAFDRTGEGPPVILVAGATANRSFPNPLVALLAPNFTVFHYDRRGRNESGDTPPYAVEREIEDIEALIKESGGSAYAYGISSGAVVALEAAASGLALTKLALYEAPLNVDSSRPAAPSDYVRQLDEAVASGRRGDAVGIFLTKAVGVPAEFVAGMRSQPMWPALEAVAHTIAYDGRFMEGVMYGKPLPPERAKRWASVTAPTLVIDGGASERFMHTGADALAQVLPNAERRTLEGQTHDVNAAVLAPVLIEFFNW
jgi:pimeloyl-ACP methyl ester carboxylesterase